MSGVGGRGKGGLEGRGMGGRGEDSRCRGETMGGFNGFSVSPGVSCRTGVSIYRPSEGLDSEGSRL